MIVGFRSVSRRVPKYSVRLLTSSHPDWDLNALNDEMEGLIGKFADSPNGRDNGLESMLPSPSSSASVREPIKTETMTKNSPSVSASNIKMPTPTLIKENIAQIPSSETCSKPSYTIFHFDEQIQHEDYVSDQAILSHKYWHHFATLDILMEELADANNNNGIIILQNQPSSGEIITPAQKNLLKIYKKSSAVVLVIAKSSGAETQSSGNYSNDISFASCIIQGFESKGGVAAAVAGMKSSRTPEEHIFKQRLCTSHLCCNSCFRKK